MQDDMVKKIHEIFKTKGLTLSFAESCTAGLLSHLITSLPGASEFFDSSIICYSNRSKEKLLGIKKSILAKHGAISEETAMAMADAMRLKTKTDFSLSITGNLGPVPIEGKKTGLVYIAVSSDSIVESKGMLFDGSRDEIKESAAIASLKYLYEVVSAWT
jgi:PncC family amidohydrolase